MQKPLLSPTFIRKREASWERSVGPGVRNEHIVNRDSGIRTGLKTQPTIPRVSRGSLVNAGHHSSTVDIQAERAPYMRLPGCRRDRRRPDGASLLPAANPVIPGRPGKWRRRPIGACVCVSRVEESVLGLLCRRISGGRRLGKGVEEGRPKEAAQEGVWRGSLPHWIVNRCVAGRVKVSRIKEAHWSWPPFSSFFFSFSSSSGK